MHQVVPLQLNVRVRERALRAVLPPAARAAILPPALRAVLPPARADRSDPLKTSRPDPALVRANADVRPFTDSLPDGDFGALMKGKQVGS